MRSFILKRLAQLVLVVITVTFLSFASINLVGTPLFNYVGVISDLDASGFCDEVAAGRAEDTFQAGQNTGDCAYIARIKEENNLDRSVPVRYGIWVGDALTGDFGSSTTQSIPVSEIVANRLPITLRLVVFASVIALGISIPWGVASAYRANRGFDRASTIGSFGLLAIPNFALAVILLYLFALRWQIFPSRYESGDWFTELKSLFLPALALGASLVATYQRLLRTDLITTLQEDFVHMARAKGMSDRHVMYRHALRPSMFSLITVFGINTGALIGGTLVIETIFSIPGVGSELVEAVIRSDAPVVMALVAIVAAGFVFINFFVDLLYGWLDPRVRSS